MKRSILKYTAVIAILVLALGAAAGLTACGGNGGGETDVPGSMEGAPVYRAGQLVLRMGTQDPH